MSSFTAYDQDQIDMAHKMGLISDNHYEASKKMAEASKAKLDAGGSAAFESVHFGMMETSFDGSEVDERYAGDKPHTLRMYLALDPKHCRIELMDEEHTVLATLNLAQAASMAKVIGTLCHKAAEEVDKVLGGDK
jgi:hypothetical protein